MTDLLVDELRSELGADRVRTDPIELALFRKDASTFDTGGAAVLVVPGDRHQVAAVVRACARHGRPFVPRGGGTGLAGGAVPLGDAPVVIALAQLDRVLEVDAAARVAWVEPGVLNLDLSRHLARWGLHFAPDPSSQQACTIGGNVANNAGGPHCLSYGVTNAHILAVELILPDGRRTVLGDLGGDPVGYDLRGVVVGSEGMLGVVTAVAVRLTPNPPAVKTMLAAFASMRDAASTVTAIIGAGLVPAAIEIMDRNAISIVEDFVGAGYPRDAAAVALIEVDGLPDGVEAAAGTVGRIATDNGATSVRIAADETERALLWKGRKAAFGAVARLEPDYYLHDTVVPRGRLVEVLEQIYRIADHHQLTVINVFHAGDGNLHPILAYDRRRPGVLERVHTAGAEIVQASLDAGGVLSGEHGIGLEKRDYMSLLFSAVDLDHQNRLRCAFDRAGLSNPGKVLPTGASCAEAQHLRHVPEEVWG
jgi:glycolate oxidase